MDLKVFFFFAVVIANIEAQPLLTGGQDLAKLFDEAKNLDRLRHDELEKAEERPEFQANDKMVNVLRTFGERNVKLIKLRRSIARASSGKDLSPSRRALLQNFLTSRPMDEGKITGVPENFKDDSQILKMETLQKDSFSILRRITTAAETSLRFTFNS